jgi:hypothetical protein
VDDTTKKEKTLEVVLPAHARLTEIAPELLAPGQLPGLWQSDTLRLMDLLDYFSGEHVVQIDRGGYEEPLPVPGADRDVVETAVRTAVQRGHLWLIAGPTSMLGEEVPTGLALDDAVLRRAPDPISYAQLLPERRPEAWRDGTTTAHDLASPLSSPDGVPLPWAVIRQAIHDAIQARALEVVEGPAPWGLPFARAHELRLRSAGHRGTDPGVREKKRVHAEAELEIFQVQELGEKIGALAKIAAGQQLRVVVQIELGTENGTPPEHVVRQANQILAGVSERLRLPEI